MPCPGHHPAASSGSQAVQGSARKPSRGSSPAPSHLDPPDFRSVVVPSAIGAMSTSEVTTQGICVRVESRFAAEHSRHEQWFFLYTVRISNQGIETVQLISRHWIIRDGNDQVEEVKGPGVVGDQPVLEPGDSYEYTSGCPLPTPFGSMQGSYQMVTAGGKHFDAEIAEFMLREPGSIH